MSSGLMSKLKSFVGLDMGSYIDDEGALFEDLHESNLDYEQPYNKNSMDVNKSVKSSLKVVSHPTTSSHEVMVVEPRAFDEALEIINYLRDRKSIVINLHLLDNEQSQRVVDFLSGATHAVDGHQQRIGDGVFLFTPPNVAISAESDKSKAIRDAFWNHPQ